MRCLAAVVVAAILAPSAGPYAFDLPGAIEAPWSPEVSLGQAYDSRTGLFLPNKCVSFEAHGPDGKFVTRIDAVETPDAATARLALGVPLGGSLAAYPAENRVIRALGDFSAPSITVAAMREQSAEAAFNATVSEPRGAEFQAKCGDMYVARIREGVRRVGAIQFGTGEAAAVAPFLEALDHGSDAPVIPQRVLAPDGTGLDDPAQLGLWLTELPRRLDPAERRPTSLVLLPYDVGPLDAQRARLHFHRVIYADLLDRADKIAQMERPALSYLFGRGIVAEDLDRMRGALRDALTEVDRQIACADCAITPETLPDPYALMARMPLSLRGAHGNRAFMPTDALRRETVNATVMRSARAACAAERRLDRAHPGCVDDFAALAERITEIVPTAPYAEQRVRLAEGRGDQQFCLAVRRGPKAQMTVCGESRTTRTSSGQFRTKGDWCLTAEPDASVVLGACDTDSAAQHWRFVAFDGVAERGPGWILNSDGACLIAERARYGKLSVGACNAESPGQTWQVDGGASG